MDKDTIIKLLLLLTTSTVLYFTGNHLTTLVNLKSVKDGCIVILFFLSLFPFVSLFFGFTGRLVKVILKNK